MEIYEFDAEIKKQDSIDATFVEFPYDVEKEFGVKGQVKVWEPLMAASIEGPWQKWDTAVTYWE